MMTPVEHSPSHLPSLEGSKEWVGSAFPSAIFLHCQNVTLDHKSKRRLPEILRPFHNEMANYRSALGTFCGEYGNFDTI